MQAWALQKNSFGAAQDCRQNPQIIGLSGGRFTLPFGAAYGDRWRVRGAVRQVPHYAPDVRVHDQPATNLHSNRTARSLHPGKMLPTETE